MGRVGYPPPFLLTSRLGETPGRHMVIGNALLYPASRGSIHITSSTDVYAPPNFDTGFLSHPADTPPLIWAYKKINEIARRMPSFVGVVGSPQPADEMPGEKLENRVYSKEDDPDVEKRVRERIQTCYHPRFVPPLSRSSDIDG